MSRVQKRAGYKGNAAKTHRNLHTQLQREVLLIVSEGVFALDISGR